MTAFDLRWLVLASLSPPRLQLAAAAVLCALGGSCVVVALAAPAAATPPGQNGLIIWQRDWLRPHLYVANADGSGARQVFANADSRWEIDGAFSPTDPNLVFFTRYSNALCSEDIYRGDLATGMVTRVRHAASADLAPAVSPDGTQIAYNAIRCRTGQTRVRVTNTDGTGDLSLTARTRGSQDPDWSPDGTRIVYSEYRFARPPEVARNRLVVMNADGTGRRALTAFGGANEFNPKWMPDSQTIIFERLRRRTRSDIFMMNAQGGALRPILATRAWEATPVPSPDGTRIVFGSDRDRRDRRDPRGDFTERFGRAMELYTMAVDGSDIDRLTTNRRPDLWPDWQHLP